jgi:hypothetical protein
MSGLRSKISGYATASPTIAQRIDKQCKGRRGLPPARVVEMIPRKRRTPIFEHALETSLGDMGLNQILRQIGEAESAQCRSEDRGERIENELAIDAYLQLLMASFELPGIQPTIGRQAQVDAGMTDQVLGLPGW